jgi:hypothetical protein
MVESLLQFVPFFAFHIETTNSSQGAQPAEGYGARRVAIRIVKNMIVGSLDLVLITYVEELARTFVE